jgi:hypothetical protein
MDNNVEHEIRKRAYELWVQGGQVPGRSNDYWLQAEREILGAARSGSDPAPMPPPSEGTAPTPALKRPARAAPRVPKGAGSGTGSPRPKRNS